MIGVSIVSAIIGLVRGASAQATAGSWQIGVATRALSYTTATTTTQLVYSTPIVNERSSWDWGFGERSNVSFEPGYGLGQHVVLGALVALEGKAQSQKDWATGESYQHSDFSFVAGPRLDLMFKPESIVRPFVGIAAGIVRANHSDERSPLSTGAPISGVRPIRDDTYSSMPGWTLRSRLGIRWFIGPHFSLDPSFFFDGSFTSDKPYDGYDVRRSSLAFGVSLGASGWIGP
jgi:hypothetical protein